MNTTKEKKASLQIIISALVLTVVLFAELYLMINYTGGFIIPIILLGVVALVAVYVMVNAIMTISAEKEAQRQAHFDNLYKSEKASYIMLKNKFEEIEKKLAVIQEASKIPSEEIINAQKGIAKVIINRSKENADAIINSNDQVLERLDEMDETQNTKFTGISKDQRLKLQDMVVQLKDMELRLNQAIMQGGGSKVAMPSAPVEENLFEDTPILAEEPVLEDTPILAEEPELEDTSILVEEPVLEDISILAEEPILEEPELEEAFVEDVLMSDPLIEELPEKEEAPAIDLSNPNKAMSPDDIAALFASMAGGDTVAVEEPVVEEVPPMPDLSDPNRALSPDEIAALIANL